MLLGQRLILLEQSLNFVFCCLVDHSPCLTYREKVNKYTTIHGKLRNLLKIFFGAWRLNSGGFNAWISRKEMFGAPMLLFWCAEARTKEWCPEGSFPNNGGRSFQIQDGKSAAVAQAKMRTLEVTGDENHIRLREVKIATK
jgi:hypothetical protein